MLILYLSASAIALILLIWHVDWQIDNPSWTDYAIVLLACLAFAIMWPSLLAGVLAGKWLGNGDD